MPPLPTSGSCRQKHGRGTPVLWAFRGVACKLAAHGPFQFQLAAPVRTSERRAWQLTRAARLHDPTGGYFADGGPVFLKAPPSVGRAAICFSLLIWALARNSHLVPGVCSGSRVLLECIPCKSPVPSRLMPPLNQSLWTLLIASLTAFAGWGLVHVSARIERERQEHRTKRGLQN
jgi:hypothetical protein